MRARRTNDAEAGVSRDAPVLPGRVVDATRGDVAAFEEIVVATSPQLYTLIIRLLGNEHDARDVMQETYLRAFRSIDGFRGDAEISTWLHRIAVNCCSTHLTRRARLHADALDPAGEVYKRLIEQNSEHKLDAVVSAVDDRTRLVAALRDLPHGLRAVVVLSDVYDMPHEAIAAELEISRAAVKVRLHRGRRRLRDALFSSETAAEAKVTEAVADGSEAAGTAGAIRCLPRTASTARQHDGDEKRGRRAVGL